MEEKQEGKVIEPTQPKVIMVTSEQLLLARFEELVKYLVDKLGEFEKKLPK